MAKEGRQRILGLLTIKNEYVSGKLQVEKLWVKRCSANKISPAHTRRLSFMVVFLMIAANA
jgi:hypothetical protein